jgi:periplasmic protein TonB
MFEDSLVESQVSHISSGKRWTALASVTLQCAVAATLVVLPLLHPERLVSRIDALPVFVPPPPKPPVHVEHVQPATASPNTSTAIPIETRSPRPSLHPTQNPTAEVPPATALVGPGMTDGVPDALSTGSYTHTTRISLAPPHVPSVPLHISTGVSTGMLLAPIRPVYPAIARAAGVQGTVVVSAVISRTGTIESLHVLSGPPMLQSAALEAIRAARYQPYRLNGEPIGVETTITVNFRMGA